VHIVTIVTLETGEKYAVDVAFGGDGPTSPLKLEAGTITTNLGTQQVHLIQEAISQFATEDKFWIYQYRNNADREWNSFYCFRETPYLFEDFEIMNYWTSTATRSFQTTTILIVRFLREQDRIMGKVMLVNGVVKKNYGGRTEVAKICHTEQERVLAFKEYFNITLTDEEVGSIKGRSSELPAIK
jgi:arylamine N-acetyltransferase